MTVTQGPGISVTGCPACVISASFPVTTLTVGRPLVAADTMHTFVYNSATPYTMPFPPVVNGWMVCLGVRGAGSLTLQPPAGAAFYNGPVVLAKGQGLCPQGDDTGNYNLGVSPSPVVPNPNAFQ